MERAYRTAAAEFHTLTAMRPLLLAAFALFGPFLTGCGSSGGLDNAPRPQEVSLTYELPEPPEPTKPAVAVVIATGEETFPHDSQGRRVIGFHDTSKKKADVVTIEPMGRWVSEAIAGELRFAGYQAAAVDDASGAICVVRPKIEELRLNSRTVVYNEEESVTIGLSYTVELGGTVVGSDSYSLRRDFSPFASIGPSKRVALEKTLRDVLIKIIPRMSKMIDSGGAGPVQ